MAMACIDIEHQKALLFGNGSLWEVMRKDEYDFMKQINKGAHGVVYRARNMRSGENVAVKKEVGGGVSQSTVTEVQIMKSLPPHPCIVGFKRAAVEAERVVVYVVMEHMDTDLHKYLQGIIRRQAALTVNQIKYIMGRILEGVRFLHQEGVMHRDIKPRNILIKAKDLKICDFGVSARSGTAAVGTVGTREYMAPEVVEGAGRQTCAVDMWSVGCIMVELVLKQRLFPERQAGVQEQLRYILQNMVLLPRKLTATTTKTKLTPSGLDLVRRLLAYKPGDRITAQDALNHPWFSVNRIGYPIPIPIPIPIH